MKIASLWTKVFLSIIVSKCTSQFLATKVYDQTIIKAAFPMSPSNIQWGQGYNSLKLYPTFNSALEVKSIDDQQRKSINIELKVCKTGGETFSFLAGELSTAGTFLTAAPSILNEYFQTSQITDLNTILVIKIDVMTSVAQIESFSLTSRATQLIKAGNFKDFSQFYGTHCLNKVFYGGFLYITMKFSSLSRKDKKVIDHQLSKLPQKYDSVSQLKNILMQLDQQEALEINIFSVGSKSPPSKPDLSGVIQFAEKFVHSFEKQCASHIHHVEYHSMFNIYDASFTFRYYALPIQEKVDMVVQISAALQDVICKTNSILELRDKDASYSFLSIEAVNKIHSVKDEITALQTGLQKKFRGLGINELDTLIAGFKYFSSRAQAALSKLLRNEKEFDTSRIFYFRSKGLGRYVSIDENNYPKLTDTSPIGLKLTHFNRISDNRVAYYKQFFLITSDTTPNYYLCMGKNNWYVFWDHKLNVDTSKCAWKLKPASSMDNSGLFAGFSDVILIYNKYWPGYVIGTTDDGQWLLTATKQSAERQTRHQWTIEKTPFLSV